MLWINVEKIEGQIWTQEFYLSLFTKWPKTKTKDSLLVHILLLYSKPLLQGFKFTLKSKGVQYFPLGQKQNINKRTERIKKLSESCKFDPEGSRGPIWNIFSASWPWRRCHHNHLFKFFDNVTIVVKVVYIDRVRLKPYNISSKLHITCLQSTYLR